MCRSAVVLTARQSCALDLRVVAEHETIKPHMIANRDLVRAMADQCGGPGSCCVRLPELSFPASAGPLSMRRAPHAANGA